jgi:tRNA (guanine26-N2/guanine27-N2)-dimethyltransferase
MDLSSPLLPRLLAAEDLDALRASVAAATAAAEADEVDAVAGEVEEEEEAAEAAPADATAGVEASAPTPGAPRPPQPPPPPLRILEGLAASGLRSFRYAHEVPRVGVVVANDMDPVAAAAIRRSAAFGGEPLGSLVVPHCADARLVCLTHEKLFDVVDLDPYGTPCTLLDSAVQAVAEGGLLCCTATDMAVLCGNASEVCWTKYGVYPVKMKACHEMALRTLLASIQAAAVRHKRHIVPLLSVSVDFYVRVFVRVYTSAASCKASASKHAYVFQCVSCESRTLQPLGRVNERNGVKKYSAGGGPTVGATCAHCGGRHVMAGPIWSAPIHDAGAVRQLRALLRADAASFPGFDKVHALLAAVDEELPDVPLYESMHQIASVLKCTPPPAVLVRSALINAGYRVSSTHACALGMKTDAPPGVVWDIMRCWVQQHPVRPPKAGDSTPGSRILEAAPTVIANFTRARGAFSKAQEEGVARFPANPEANWGPKSRAGRVAPAEPQQQQPAKKARS